MRFSARSIKPFRRSCGHKIWWTDIHKYERTGGDYRLASLAKKLYMKEYYGRCLLRSMISLFYSNTIIVYICLFPISFKIVEPIELEQNFVGMLSLRLKNPDYHPSRRKTDKLIFSVKVNLAAFLKLNSEDFCFISLISS